MTYWTPLGSHPENEKDLTPRWFRLSFIVALFVVFVVSLINLSQAKGDQPFYLIWLVVGTNSLGRVIFNWRQGMRYMRYFDLFLSTVFIFFGVFFFFRPK